MPGAVHSRWTGLGALVWAAAAVVAAAQGAPAVSYAQKVRTFYAADAFARATAGRVRIERGRDPAQEATLREANIQLPNTRFAVLQAGPQQKIWIGTRDGAMRVDVPARTVEYFAGLRWLPDDNVTGIGFDGDSTWLETPRGFSQITYVPMTLEEKSRAFVARVQSRHNRWGLTSDSRLATPGDLSTSQLVANDNDGLWTAMYVAAECFRYKVTGERDARDNARQGINALMRLESITGIPGFPARTFVKVGEGPLPTEGEWHETPDKAWRWKGDTSSDEIVGHYFAYSVYYDLLADASEKPALRAVVERITTHILDHDYRLIGPDGRPTRWGWWGPEAVWRDADETGLRALHILSHLRVAMHLTESAQNRSRYQAAYDDLIRSHEYHRLTRYQKIAVPGHVNHSDDELAFLSFYPLLRYETDAALLEVYRDSLERSWQVERPERNPLWNVIYGAGSGAAEFDREASLRTLREIPMDLINWTVRNSSRQDVPVDPLPDRFHNRQSLMVLPYDELPMWKWNGNPYALDGGHGGTGEDDGAYFLLPYWMGRYHQLLPP